MTSAIEEFCKTRKLDYKTQEAFTLYIKTSYSSSLAVRFGETLDKIVANLTNEKVEDMWIKFVYDWKDTLPIED
jgi:hypothetical protein